MGLGRQGLRGPVSFHLGRILRRVPSRHADKALPQVPSALGTAKVEKISGYIGRSILRTKHKKSRKDQHTQYCHSKEGRLTRLC